MHTIVRNIERKKLLWSKFFEGVSIEKTRNQDWFLNWIINLQYIKDIKISRFKDFFSKNPEIIFPIKICYFYRTRMIIKDNLENEYYFFFNTWNWEEMTKYSIGRRDNKYDKEYTYEITTKNEKLLTELMVLEVDENGKNKQDMITIQYDYKNTTTKVMLEQPKTVLQVEYTTQGTEFDNQIIEYLFYLSNNEVNVDNVYNIFAEILKKFKEKSEEIYLNIMSKNNNENNKELLSQITVLNGMVTHYTFTKRESNEEWGTYHNKLPISLKEFMH